MGNVGMTRRSPGQQYVPVPDRQQASSTEGWRCPKALQVRFDVGLDKDAIPDNVRVGGRRRCRFRVAKERIARGIQISAETASVASQTWIVFKRCGKC